MADENRTPSHSVTLIDQLHETPYAFDFYQAIRRLDCCYPDKPQTGHSSRVIDDPIRLGQEASMAFAPATIESCEKREERPPRLVQRFFGLLGPQGPLPLHITEYVRDRLRNHDDYTLLRFLDIFHHRLLTLFYRAWARVRPTVSFDNAAHDRYSDYVGSFFGLGMRSLKNRNAFPDLPKRHFVGLMSCQTKHADGLLAILRGYFRLPVQIEEFVGQWVELPSNCRCLLGCSSAKLGVDTIVGSHIWDCQQKFRIVLGPLTLDEYYRMLPGKSELSSPLEAEPLDSATPIHDPEGLPFPLDEDLLSADEELLTGGGTLPDESPLADETLLPADELPVGDGNLAVEDRLPAESKTNPQNEGGPELPAGKGGAPSDAQSPDAAAENGPERPAKKEAASSNGPRQPGQSDPTNGNRPAGKQFDSAQGPAGNGNPARRPVAPSSRALSGKEFVPAAESRLPSGRGVPTGGKPVISAADAAAPASGARATQAAQARAQRTRHAGAAGQVVPRGVSLERLIAAVRSYVGDEWQWDLQLVLLKDETPPIGLGIVGNLGWSSWVIRDHLLQDPSDLVLDATQKPSSGQRIEFRYVKDWSHATLGQKRDGQYILATIDAADLQPAVMQ